MYLTVASHFVILKNVYFSVFLFSSSSHPTGSFALSESLRQELYFAGVSDTIHTTQVLPYFIKTGLIQCENAEYVEMKRRVYPENEPSSFLVCE